MAVDVVAIVLRADETIIDKSVVKDVIPSPLARQVTIFTPSTRVDYWDYIHST